MTEIMPYAPPGSAEIDYTWNLANKLCKTEFVPANLRNRPEAILAVFLTGRELGIGPMQSLRDIYPVNGRPALMASLMVSRVRGLGHRFKTLESTDTTAVVQVHRKGEPEPEPPIRFTLEDAKRAELTGKAVWRQYPKAMLWNRAASAACRRDCPEALGGAVYTPEELGDGDGTTTATWGAPEPPNQTADPASAPPRGLAGSAPTSEAGRTLEETPLAAGAVAGSNPASARPASDLNASVTGPGDTDVPAGHEPPNAEAPRPSEPSSLGTEGRRAGRRGPPAPPAEPEQAELGGGS